MNDTTLTPEQVSENELICKKLLGWHPPGGHADIWWHKPNGRIVPKDEMPTFTTWAEAGLILDALRARGVITSIQFTTAGYCAIDSVCSEPPAVENIPLAIRTAAIRYIKAVKS